MFKSILAAAVLVPIFGPVAFADIRQIDEATTVTAIGSPVLKKTQDEDSPGCNVTRYTFGDKTFDMKLEFKCNRINVGWIGSTEPQFEARSKKAVELAQRAVSVLSGGDGIEVERVLAGGKYDGRTYSNGLSVSGSCVMNSCLLTFK